MFFVPVLTRKKLIFNEWGKTQVSSSLVSSHLEQNTVTYKNNFNFNFLAYYSGQPRDER